MPRPPRAGPGVLGLGPRLGPLITRLLHHAPWQMLHLHFSPVLYFVCSSLLSPPTHVVDIFNPAKTYGNGSEDPE